MSTSPVKSAATVKSVRFSEHWLEVSLNDGRQIRVPLEWFPLLAAASRQQRENWEPIARGRGIHWPDIDEDISVAGLFDPDSAKWLRRRSELRKNSVSSTQAGQSNRLEPGQSLRRR